MNQLRRWFTKPLVMGIIAIAIATTASLIVFAQTSAGDCDDNAVIRCGASSPAAVQQAYNQTAHVRKIFSCMGISQNDVANLPNTAVKGYVTRGGDVYANGDLVATGALTGGRQNISGSKDRTQECGTSFFERSPNVSFASGVGQLPALVSLNQNGVFQFAVITSCGNPVTAVAVKPKPTPKPKPQQPPAPKCTNLDIAQTGTDNRSVKITDFQYDANGSNFNYATLQWGDTQTTRVTKSNNVIGQTHSYPKLDVDKTYTVSVTIHFTQSDGTAVDVMGHDCQKNITIHTSPKVPPTIAAPPAELANTGAGSVVGLFAVVSSLGVLGYRLFLTRRLAK